MKDDRIDHAEYVNASVEEAQLVSDLRAENTRLREALRFYADPGKVIEGAEWSEGYPGGITYIDSDGFVIMDTGQIASDALAGGGR